MTPSVYGVGNFRNPTGSVVSCPSKPVLAALRRELATPVEGADATSVNCASHHPAAHRIHRKIGPDGARGPKIAKTLVFCGFSSFLAI